MKKNILIILQSIPYPLNTGGRQAVFNSIDSIRDCHNIFITCYNDRNKKSLVELSLLWPNVKLVPFIENKKGSDRYYVIKKVFQKFLKKIFQGCELLIIDDLLNQRISSYNPNYYDHINKLISKYKIDIVQCEFMSNLSLIYGLPENVSTVFVHHELGYVRNNQVFKSLNKNLNYNNYIKSMLKSDEINTLSEYDAVITLSTVDAIKLKNEGVKTKIFSSFAMVKVDKKKNEINDFSYKLTFVGPEAHFPNKNGLEWFLNEVWPGLLEKNENWNIVVIGNWEANTINKWCSKYRNLRFAGYVDNISDELKDSIMIVPIHIGSGIRMKLQEAAYMGIPFVSTTVGAEGLPFKNEEDCFIADSPLDFQNALVKLENIDLQRKFADSAYNTINKCLSIEKLRDSRLVVYNNL